MPLPRFFSRAGLRHISLLLHTAFVYYEINNPARFYIYYLTIVSVLPASRKIDDTPLTPPKPDDDNKNK